jgi:2-polyprenyl-3-methyl-5-hydroxy-6-metoxy-1,4-benzoquinol methylase
MIPPVFNPDWPADVLAVYRHDMQEMWNASIAPNVWNQYHNQIRTYRSLAGHGPLDILDVGCAQGTLALLLAEDGHRVCAMDIRQQFLDYAMSRYERGDIRFVRGNVLETEPEGKFDLIYANQIIEHLVYPLKLVQRLVSWLRPGGRLVVTTPNWHYLVNTLPSFDELGDPSQYEHRQFTADGDGHFFAYRADEVLQVFSKAGLAKSRTRYFETPWISGHMKLRYLHPWVPTRFLMSMERLTLTIPGMARTFSHQLMTIGELPA